MKILMYNNYGDIVPPLRYGGVERYLAWLIDGLVQRGHQVDLIADLKSKTKCHIIPCGVDKKVTLRYTLFNTENFYDIIHEHGQCGLIQNKNYLWTNSDSEKNLFRKYRNKVYHSKLQAEVDNLPDKYVNIGMPVDEVIYDDNKEDYFVYTSAIGYRHGIDIAIQTALKTKTKLVIVTDCPKDYPVFQEFVGPYLGDYVEHFYLGDYDDETANVKKMQVVSKAKALLAPTRDTTFGIVLLEAMAAGTPCMVLIGDDPVILPPKEIIRHNLTGFHCKDIDDFVKYSKELGKLDSSICREEVEVRFSQDQMVEGYIALYKRILEGEQWLE